MLLRTVLLSLVLTTTALPIQAGMFQIRDQNPLVLPYGLPMKAYAELPDNGRWRGFLSYSRSSTSLEEGDPGGSEYLVIEGETARTDLMIFRGLEKNWALGLHIPFIQHTDHGLENIIETAQGTLGGRNDNARNRLSFLYRKDGVDKLEFTEGVSGVGDIAVLLGYQWQRSGVSRLALYLQFKLPTGDPDKLLGSGSLDYANWFTAVTRVADNVLVNGDFGISVLGNGDILSEQQRSHVFFGGTGVEWIYHPRLRLKLQMDYHGSMFSQTHIEFFDKVVMVSGGASVQLTNNLYADFALVDDFFRGRSPDITVHFALRYHPGGDFR